MTSHPQPPVPRRLKELLTDHPELIARIQEALSFSADKSRRSPFAPFEDAVSVLQGEFDAMLSDARKEVARAEARDDATAIATAKQKEALVAKARYKGNWIGDEELFDYFKRQFE